MTSRSMPMPMPPVGGMPYSRASRKSSSTCIASGSPAAARSDWATSRSRCSSGSVSSRVRRALLGGEDHQIPLLGEPWIVAVLAGERRILLGEIGVEDRRRRRALAQLAVDLLEHDVPSVALGSISSPIARACWCSTEPGCPV